MGLYLLSLMFCAIMKFYITCFLFLSRQSAVTRSAHTPTISGSYRSRLTISCNYKHYFLVLLEKERPECVMRSREETRAAKV